MRTTSSDVVGIVCSDLHFSHLPPIARAVEGVDWYDVMGGYIGQLTKLATMYGVPIIVAGDIFDRWDSPAELINFVLDRFDSVTIYAVPGQHDLPNHSIDDVHRSAYWTLATAGTIKHISPRASYMVGAQSINLYGFPWREEIQPPWQGKSRSDLDIAVAHRYIWTANHRYTGASKIYSAKSYTADLKGYDAAIFGDNHKGFQTKVGKCNVMNGGSFIRRTSDEIDYKPTIGKLMSDGTIVPRSLDTRRDQFVTGSDSVELTKALGLDSKDAERLDAFLKATANLDDSSHSFQQSVRDWIKHSSTGSVVKQIIMEILDL